MAEDKKISASSLALKALIDERGWAAIAEAASMHRTALWKYATGLRKPDAEGVARLHRISDGKVAADGWETFPAVEPVTGTHGGGQ